MNAYELADKLENKDRFWNVDENLMLKNCAMLRQQADRIAELSKNVDELEEELLKATHPNSEPVAWMLTLPDGTHDWILDGKGCEGYIPLYTAPQIKELSDDEILSLSAFKSSPYDAFIEYEKEDLIKFARAILKKASEK